MEKKIKNVLVEILFLTSLFGYSQEPVKQEKMSKDDCIARFSTYYHQSYKPKKYSDAYPSWKIAFYDCMSHYKPAYKKAVISHGRTILGARIKEAKTPEEKRERVKDLMSYYEKLREYLPNKKSYCLACEGLSMFQHQIDMDGSYKLLKKSIEINTNPEDIPIGAIDAFFKNSVYLFNKKKITDTDVFADFDKVMELIETLSGKLAIISNKLKSDTTKVLTKKEKRQLVINTKKVEALKKLGSNSNKLIAPIATKERLVLLYAQKFEENKTNKNWLQSALSMLGRKKCQKEKIYKDIATEYYKLEPSYKSAKALGLLNMISNHLENSEKYYNEALNFAKTEHQKSDCYIELAKVFSVGKSRAKKIKSRDYARKALKINKYISDPYFIIGMLYVNSANECGSNLFEKKAVYWAAISKFRQALPYADEEDKATIMKAIKGYSNQVPTKDLIFQFGYIDKPTYRINCWINETVRIPKQ